MRGNEKRSVPRQELKEKIIEKAQVDQEFSKALIENPKRALGQSGVQLPEGVTIKVVEESPRVLYLVLPVDPGELADEQLDNVTAGFCPDVGAPAPHRV
ncbi:MAG TPA: NHLP leader peptide family RiPP precursor [Bacillota bacterium]|nr:NHLP leader peptide family RiPP precursor [Bacillota bacterium]